MAVNWQAPDLRDALSRTDAGRFVHQPEVEAFLARRARHAALAELCPALANASTVLGTFNCPVQPLDRRTLQPSGPTLATTDELLAHFEDRPRDFAAVETGPRGSWSLVAVEASSWQGWLDWLTGVAGVRSTRLLEDGLRAPANDLRFYGRPGALVWDRPPRRVVIDYGVAIGTRGEAEQAAAAQQRSRDVDHGGYLVWAALTDERGRLPRFKDRRVHDHVRVLGDGSLLPIFADDERGTLALRGWADPVPDAAPPPWFVSVLGGRY